MKISQIDIQKLLSDIALGAPKPEAAEIVDRLLFRGLEDAGQCGDFALVFGSPTCTRRRGPLGASLVLSERAEFLLLSGGKALPGLKITEAEAMKAAALEAGVPENKIFIENASMFTHENVSFSAELMKKIITGRPLRILAVTSGYHMRRAMLNFSHFLDCFPTGSEFYPCPAESEHAGRESWSLTQKGRDIVSQQCRSLYEYVGLGYLPDIEI